MSKTLVISTEVIFAAVVDVFTNNNTSLYVVGEDIYHDGTTII